MAADGSATSTRSRTSPATSATRPTPPTATRILFQSNADGDREIYVINLDDTGLQQLTHQ